MRARKTLRWQIASAQLLSASFVGVLVVKIFQNTLPKIYSELGIPVNETLCRFHKTRGVKVASRALRNKLTTNNQKSLLSV